MGLMDRLSHAWNAFVNLDKKEWAWNTSAGSYGQRPDRVRHSYTSQKSILSSIYTRMAIDVSSAMMNHVRNDAQGRFADVIDSGLNECLTVEANLDQAATAFRIDWVLSLFGEGVIAVVPVDTTVNPNDFGSFDIKTMRVGRITQWMPEHVRVDLYNEKTGRHEEVVVPKKATAIVENPMYNVMNETSGTLQRLARKINLLDAVDEASGSGKMDLIIQLPYVVKSETRIAQAEQRRKDIEFQLKGSQYGIAYVDGTEKITQLNRPSENNLLAQIEYLTEGLYNELGLTKDIMNGTASESVMLNYYVRTIDPILNALVEEMRRKFLTKTARTQRQSIVYFRDPFAIVPMEKLAELVDKLTRNEIFTSNEVRAIFKYRPIKDGKADELRNSNMPESELGRGQQPAGTVQARTQRLDKPEPAQIEPPS